MTQGAGTSEILRDGWQRVNSGKSLQVWRPDSTGPQARISGRVVVLYS